MIGPGDALRWRGERLDLTRPWRRYAVREATPRLGGVPADRLETSAEELAQCIARRSGAALRFTKRCVRDAWVVQRELLFRASRLYVDNLMGTEDAVAGLAGFLEKRQPVWTHE